MTAFRSIEEVEKQYFPDHFKKNQWDKMTPEEKGRAMAAETINRVRNHKQPEC
ncbi:MAG: hypothetical protein KAS66_15290 [Candidatus Omnitrophica bacterium]|nr:hypothetical protein [Candidatus Omnitrophota bacterium]